MSDISQEVADAFQRFNLSVPERDDLTDEEVMAVSKLFTTTDVRRASAGVEATGCPCHVGPCSKGHDTRTVRGTIEFEVTYKRGEDYQQAIVAKARPWALLVAALNKLNGVTIDALVRDADSILPASEQELRREASEAMRDLKGETITDCNGKITIQRRECKILRQR